MSRCKREWASVLVITYCLQKNKIKKVTVKLTVQEMDGTIICSQVSIVNAACVSYTKRVSERREEQGWNSSRPRKHALA